MNTFERIKKALGRWMPSRRVVYWNRRNEPPALAQSMDVDMVHSILRDAEAGNTSRLFSLYRDILATDSHVQAEFSKRKLAVLGDPMTLLPSRSNDPVDAAAAKTVQSILSQYDGLIDALNHLLDSTLWPVSVIGKVFKPGTRPGISFEIEELYPVAYDLLDYTTGEMRIWDTDPVMKTRLGTAHAFDPDIYVAHRGHMLTFPDWWGGPMRSMVFWWLMSVMDRDWWARFLERFGAPFIVGKYDQADDDSRMVLQDAFAAASRVFGLVVSNETSVELQQAATSQSGEAFERFLTICQREKSKLIVGQTLSSEAQSTGLGSGTSNSQERVRGDIRQWDALRLGMTLRSGIIRPLMRYNNIPGEAPMPTWSADNPQDAVSMGELLSKLSTSGLTPTDAALPAISQRLGFEVQRGQVAMPGMGALALAALGDPMALRGADEANARVASGASADIARAFSGSLAPLRHVILSSNSPEEVASKVRALYVGWDGRRVSSLVEQALLAFAGNGVS